MADYPPTVAGVGWALRQALCKLLSGLYPGTLAKATLIVVEMKTTLTRYVFTSVTPSYNPGTEDDPETDPPSFTLSGNMQLPAAISPCTPKKLHLCGSLGTSPCESLEALEEIIEGGDADEFKAVLLGTHEIDVVDEVEYQASQLISGAVTVPLTDETV